MQNFKLLSMTINMITNFHPLHSISYRFWDKYKFRVLWSCDLAGHGTLKYANLKNLKKKNIGHWYIYTLYMHCKLYPCDPKFPFCSISTSSMDWWTHVWTCTPHQSIIPHNTILLNLWRDQFTIWSTYKGQCT